MKIRYYFLLLIATLTVTFKSVAQTYNKIEYPFVGGSTTDYVCIKAITFRSYETRIDFVACYTGNYIFLEKAGQRNALYIRIGKRKYRLQNTYGIASTDRVTFCQPGQLLEFSAIFEPIPDKERDNFDLIEGIDGTWNFYKVSISKYLSYEKIPNWIKTDKRNGTEVSFREETIEYPYVEKQSHPYLIIMKIDKFIDGTIIYFTYKKPYDGNGLINLSNDIYLRASDGKKYDMLKIVGVPFTDEYTKRGTPLSFSMIFPRLPNNIDCFSLYQPSLFYDAKGLVFHNIKLRSDYDGYLRKWNDLEFYFRNTSQKKIQYQNRSRKQLMKDPNFKID